MPSRPVRKRVVLRRSLVKDGTVNPFTWISGTLSTNRPLIPLTPSLSPKGGEGARRAGAGETWVPEERVRGLSHNTTIPHNRFTAASSHRLFLKPNAGTITKAPSKVPLT